MLQYLERRRTRQTERKTLQAALGHQVRHRLGLGENDLVRVGEIACGDPGCADIETVVLIMRSGRRTEAVKVTAAMADVSTEDIESVVTQFQDRFADAIGAPR